ncbi:MAG: phosphate acyltransferase PlsX [Clostridia bacterium]|nr:phosphate acyltransferase PlsX [Clostridia bacterium]
MKIVIDAMGGDKPEEIVKGALKSAKSYSDIDITLVGDEALIKKVITEENGENLLKTVFTDEIITNEDSPTMAIKTKKNSSMVKSLDLLKEDGDTIGMVSTGSTGAVLTGSTLLIGRLPGIYRPTLLAQLPNFGGGLTCITDGGANVDSHPEWLYQFAIMGNAYMKAITGKDNPTVSLLSVGTEEHKGNELNRQAFPLLKNGNFNFIGNIEARDALNGDYDLIVCDGYAGNILIKSSEGAAKMVMKLLKESISSSRSAKFGYLFMRKALKNMKSRMDYNNYGGAPFLGINKCVIKSHGSSNAASIYASVDQVLKIHHGKVIEAIKNEIADQKNENN